MSHTHKQSCINIKTDTMWTFSGLHSSHTRIKMMYYSRQVVCVFVCVGHPRAHVSPAGTRWFFSDVFLWLYVLCCRLCTPTAWVFVRSVVVVYTEVIKRSERISRANPVTILSHSQRNCWVRGWVSFKQKENMTSEEFAHTHTHRHCARTHAHRLDVVVPLTRTTTTRARGKRCWARPLCTVTEFRLRIFHIHTAWVPHSLYTHTHTYLHCRIVAYYVRALGGVYANVFACVRSHVCRRNVRARGLEGYAHVCVCRRALICNCI